MRPVSLLAALTVPLLGVQAVMPPSVQAQARNVVQWRMMAVNRCARADSLFGRLWRSHPSGVRVSYSPARDTTAIRTRLRTASWEVSTSSQLVGTEAGIELPGQLRQADSARIELSLRFVDSIYRAPEQVQLVLHVEGSTQMEILEPRVDYAVGVNVRGVPLVVTALLTPEQSLAVARAAEVRGSMGPYPFFLYRFEMWDINAIYRASICGVN